MILKIFNYKLFYIQNKLFQTHNLIYNNRSESFIILVPIHGQLAIDTDLMR